MADKIVYLLDSFDGPYGGTERQLWQLLKGLDRRRFEPEVVLLRHTAFTRAGDAWPCPVRILCIDKLFSVAGVRRLIGLLKYLKQSNARILQVFFTDASVLGPVLAKLTGMKFVTSRRDMGIWYTPTILRVLGALSGVVDRAIVNSAAVRDLVVQKEGIPRERIHVIVNGLEALAGNATPGDDERKTSAGPVFGIVANLKKVKRIDDLLRAFKEVRDSIGAARLIVVGEGELEDELKTLANQLGVGDGVDFTGRLDDPPAMIARFDIAVLCSESEGMSNALMEYLRAGKPVVCTAVGGNPELVEDGRNGYLVPVGDYAALARAMLRIASDKALYDAMSRQAQRSVEHYTVDAMVRQHMDVYHELVQKDKA